MIKRWYITLTIALIPVEWFLIIYDLIKGNDYPLHTANVLAEGGLAWLMATLLMYNMAKSEHGKKSMVAYFFSSTNAKYIGFALLWIVIRL